MIEPHSSCRYALVQSGYTSHGETVVDIVAVHAVGEKSLLVSQVSSRWAERLAFTAPRYVDAQYVVGMASNFKAAYGLRQDLRKEGDHEER